MGTTSAGARCGGSSDDGDNDSGGVELSAGASACAGSAILSPVSAMAPAPAPAATTWWVACSRCARALATSDQLYFVLECERGAHLALRKHLLVDVQARMTSHEGANAAAARTKSWSLHSHAHVSPPIRFTKTRTLNARKRVRVPFEINCPGCQIKVAAECQINERPGIEYLLDSKSCTCVIASEATEAPGATKRTRKWGAVLKKLQMLELPVLTETVAAEDLSDDLKQQQPVDHVTTQFESKRQLATGRLLDGAALVFPTTASIRASFARTCKLSALRSYQLELVLSALLENTIVYLPTGAGKTLVAVKVIDEVVRLNPGRLAVVFVPTGPLVTQQAAYVRRETDLNVLELSGQHTSALATRLAQLTTDPKLHVLVVTPQYFSNLVFRRTVAISDFSVLVFDEAHHATGDHPYRAILQRVAAMPRAQQPRLLALTASPFGESRVVTSSQATLQQLEGSFSARANTPTLHGRDLGETLQTKSAEWVVVQPSAAEATIRAHLKAYTEALLARIKDLVHDDVPLTGASYDSDDLELTQLLSRLRVLREREEQSDDVSDLELLIQHVQKILSSFFDLSIHGAAHVANALYHHFTGLAYAASPLTRRQYALVYPQYSRHLLSTVIELHRDGRSGALALDDVSSRVHLVAAIVQRANFTHESRAIVFVRRRKTAIELAKAMEKLATLRPLNPTRFIGHNSYEGMSWEDEQKPTLERFRQGRIRLLVATNVLEEGLDVPECSLVILFDGIKSITSLIQSRGRARRANGLFVVFCSPHSVAQQQQLVEREAHYFQVAKAVAEKIPSKATVKSLLEDLERRDERSSSSDTEDPRASTRETAAAAVAARPAAADVVTSYNILLGGVFDQDNQDFRTSVLSDIEALATVCCVDEKLGLCSLAPLPDDSVMTSYAKLCESLAFGDAPTRFWIKFDNIEADATLLEMYQRVDERFALRVVGVERGVWSLSTSSFVPVESLLAPGDDGNLDVTFHGASVRVPLVRERSMVLDLRQLSESVVCFDAASSPDEVAVYVSLLVPPQFYHKTSRAHVDCQFQSHVYRLRMPVHGDESWHMRLFFMKLGIEVRDTHVRVEPSDALADEQTDEQPPAPHETFPFDVAYALLCFQSRVSFFTNGRLSHDFLALLSQLDRDVQARALVAFEPPTKILSGRSPLALNSVTDDFQRFVADEWAVLKGLDATADDQVVYKVVVTPTRVVFRAPEVAPDNRVFRRFGSKHFMYVYFREENMDRLDFAHAPIVQRIRDVMETGITVDHAEGEEGPRRFQFLGCSLSQLRNSSCLFTTLDPHAVRRWIGDLSHIHSPAKYLKRMSQAFSATKPAFRIDHERFVNPADDIHRNGYVFTDGCGEISRTGAAKVAEALALPDVPSAFQIRLGGVKGVVVVSDVPDALVDKETSIVLRKSMVKFASAHNVLEVVACAGRSVAYLTRQSIQILSSLGIRDDVFMSMQDAFLEELSSMVASDAEAFFMLKRVLPAHMSWWIEVFLKQLGVSLLSDGFLGSLVDTIYRYHIANTVLRARIPVHKGRALMGVADFTRTLAHGQVFVRYSERVGESDEYRTVTLDNVDVLVHRSPCHHPGDIRVLQCRADVPRQLQQLRDCIVFPCDGPRPHPDECTGGDLDGDVFTVIWDDRLVPPRERVHAPMVFPSAGAEKCERVDDSSLIAFYVKSIQHDALGVASNAHLALSDYAKDGIFDKGALELAQICSLQVDNDQAAEHLERVRALAPAIYPDFMKNKEKGSYKSKKVLGVLYRRCDAVMNAALKHIGDRGAHVDQSMLADGYERYLDTARIAYRQYKQRVAALLLASGATCEAELALGMIVEPESLFKAEYFRFGEHFKEAFNALQAAVWSDFSVFVEDLSPSETPRVASAWYVAAYSDALDTRRCLSFAWVVIRVLIATAAARTADQHKRAWTPTRSLTRKTILPDLQISLLGEVQVRTDELLSDLFDRLVALSSLRSALAPHFHARPFDLVLFGSSALLTFENQSDLDIVVQSRTSDLGAVAKFVERSFSQVEYRPSIRVPLLSFSFEQWAIEMSASKSGPLKTRLFRLYMAKYPFFWPCVYFLVRWGKCVGLVTRRSGGGLNLFSPTGFMWLFLRFCIAHAFVAELDWRAVTLDAILRDNTADAKISFWTAHLTALVSGVEHATTASAARVLMAFLTHYADLATPVSAFAFTDPFDATNDTQLNAADTAPFREKCYVAVHLLLISRGDIKCLLTQQPDQTSKITLSRALSKRVSAARDFFERKILFEALASPGTELAFVRHPNSFRPDLLVAEIRGDGESLQRIEEKLQTIEKELGAPQLQHSKKLFHREGSSLVLFEGAVSQDDEIGFQEYFGSFHAMHGHARLHQAHLVCFMNGLAWYDHAATCFSARFVRQMIKLTRFERIHSSTAAPTVNAFIRFGHHYLIHLPRSFHDETIALASIKTLEEEFERGRTTRELYESVLVAKREARASTSEDGDAADSDALNGDGHDHADSGSGHGGAAQDASTGDDDERTRHRRRKPKAVALSKASAVVSKDKGVTHSFYTEVEPEHRLRIAAFALRQKRMELVAKSETYGASMVFDYAEYLVKLTPELTFQKLKTRPSRWFSATLKMRQELDEERGVMDATPDARFYVSTTESVPVTHPLHRKLTSLCSSARHGRGVLDFVDDATRTKVRLSDAMIDAGEKSGTIPTVRHVTAETYECPASGLQLSLMRVREFTTPSMVPDEGFLNVKEKIEVEFALPALTAEQRHDPAFARSFLATGVEFVEYLRTQAQLSPTHAVVTRRGASTGGAAAVNGDVVAESEVTASGTSASDSCDDCRDA